MALPEFFLQELEARSDITEIASDYVNLKRRSRNMVGLCPFHSEKTPSFNIYTESNSYYCFGCGAGGGVVNFVMQIENLDYIEAIKLLAQRAGLTMPEDSYDDSLSRLKLRIYEANRAAARFFYAQLYEKSGQQALEYLHKRGLSDAAIRHFGLGFSPIDRFSLGNYLKKLGFKNDEIVAANLAYLSKNETSLGGDRFSNRIMFPIFDLRGNVIAFGGRIMTDEKPKYLNTNDTMVFKKSNNLYSLNNAKKTNTNSLILCEGYMDVIALNQAGFKNAVASLGTALTSEHAQLIKRYTDEIIICYDSDEAGQKATEKAIDILQKTGISIKVLQLPSGKDPDEYIKSHGENGQAAFKNSLDSAINYLEYRLKKMRNGFKLGTDAGIVAYLKEAAKLLATLESPIEQDKYAATLSDEFSVGKESIKQQINTFIQKNNRSYERKEIPRLQKQINESYTSDVKKIAKTDRKKKAEAKLLACLIENPEKAEYVKNNVDESLFSDELNKRLYIYILKRLILGQNNILLSMPGDGFTTDECAYAAKLKALYITSKMSAEMISENIEIIKKEAEKPTDEVLKTASNEELKSLMEKLKREKS